MLRIKFSFFQDKSDVVLYQSSFVLSEYVLCGLDYRTVTPLRSYTADIDLKISPRIIWCFICGLDRVVKLVKGMPIQDWLRYLAGNLVRNYELATIEAFDPKVVISDIDNSFNFQWIARWARNIHVIATANSHRDVSNFTEQLTMPSYHPASKYFYENYYGYGARDRDLFKFYGHNIVNFFSVGPVRYGYYLSQKLCPEVPVDFDICLISQYEPSIMNQDGMPDIRMGITKLHEFVRKYALDNSIRLCIALRSNRECEKKYFEAFFGSEVSIPDYGLRAMSSYRLIDRSRVTITLDSTAGREAFGACHKVLFANYSKNKSRSFFADGPWFDSSGTFEGFSAKIDALIGMPFIDYEIMTRTIRRQVMDFKFDAPAHKVVREAIEAALSATPTDASSSVPSTTN